MIGKGPLASSRENRPAATTEAAWRAAEDVPLDVEFRRGPAAHGVAQDVYACSRARILALAHFWWTCRKSAKTMPLDLVPGQPSLGEGRGALWQLWAGRAGRAPVLRSSLPQPEADAERHRQVRRAVVAPRLAAVELGRDGEQLALHGRRYHAGLRQVADRAKSSAMLVASSWRGMRPTRAAGRYCGPPGQPCPPPTIRYRTTGGRPGADQVSRSTGNSPSVAVPSLAPPRSR